MAVVYEWDIESRTVYEDGSFDINDHNFSDTLEWYCKGNYLAEVDGKHFVLADAVIPVGLVKPYSPTVHSAFIMLRTLLKAKCQQPIGQTR